MWGSLEALPITSAFELNSGNLAYISVDSLTTAAAAALENGESLQRAVSCAVREGV